MPGYLIDEGGERTHAVIPVEEYERLVRGSERLAVLRGYAMEMVAAVEEEDGEASVETAGTSDEEPAVESAETNGTSGTSEEDAEPQRYGWQS